MIDEMSEFKSGINASMDPFNKDKLKGGTGITTLSSDWLFRKCGTCGHTFRLDDAVIISEQAEVHHNTEMLRCSGTEATGNAADPEEMLEYYTGIIEAYAPAEGYLAAILTPGNTELAHLLEPARHGFQRYHCGICTHTLRENDLVVICPCSPEAPRCRMAIHWDPFRGLNCWGEWSSNKKHLYCPTFSQKFSNG